MFSQFDNVADLKKLLKNKEDKVLSPDEELFIEHNKHKSLEQICLPSIDMISECIINQRVYAEQMEKYNTQYVLYTDDVKKFLKESIRKQHMPLNTKETYYPVKLGVGLYRACNHVLTENCKKNMINNGYDKYFH